jgi:hypothetical protein
LFFIPRLGLFFSPHSHHFSSKLQHLLTTMRHCRRYDRKNAWLLPIIEEAAEKLSKCTYRIS